MTPSNQPKDHQDRGDGFTHFDGDSCSQPPVESRLVDEILRKLEVDILEVVGVEFAPKQEGGSPERQKLLGLIGETTPLILEAKAELISYIEGITKESRLDELRRASLVAEELLEYGRAMAEERDGKLVYGVTSEYFTERISELQGAERATTKKLKGDGTVAKKGGV